MKYIYYIYFFNFKGIKIVIGNKKKIKSNDKENMVKLLSYWNIISGIGKKTVEFDIRIVKEEFESFGKIRTRKNWLLRIS